MNSEQKLTDEEIINIFNETEKTLRGTKPLSNKEDTYGKVKSSGKKSKANKTIK